ncbi:hypothetical protein PG997_003430 [Apiospora hydei]|uniref:Uncharacterized protein n=1 Tax=Apiospora hydei TaxID=1337664 RepID=A0ABR1WZC1_9PEZI
MSHTTENASGSQSCQESSKRLFVQQRKGQIVNGTCRRRDEIHTPVHEGCSESPEELLEANYLESREHPKNQGKATKRRNDNITAIDVDRRPANPVSRVRFATALEDGRTADSDLVD